VCVCVDECVNDNVCGVDDEEKVCVCVCGQVMENVSAPQQNKKKCVKFVCIVLGRDK